MIDRPDRKTPRFPPSKELPVQITIAEAIQKIKSRFPEIEGIAGGACGGDILFHEACLHHQLVTEMVIPLAPEELLTQSVAFAGPAWTQRFNKLLTAIPYRVLNSEAPSNSNIWDYTNREMMKPAASPGNDNCLLLALWDMREENIPGGTYSMIQLAQANGITIQFININTL